LTRAASRSSVASARPRRVRPFSLALAPSSRLTPHPSPQPPTPAPQPPQQQAVVASYPVRPLLTAHDAIPGALSEGDRLRALCEYLSAVELHSARAHFAAGNASGGAACSLGVQAPLAVADCLASWQAAVEAACADGSVRFAATQPPDGAAQRLSALRDAWAQEEAAWLALQGDADAAAAAAQEATGPDQADTQMLMEQQAAVDAAVLRVCSGSALGTLRKAVEEAHLRLELQSDGVAALLTGADVLASRAESACGALTASLQAAENRALAVQPDDSPRAILRALAA